MWNPESGKILLVESEIQNLGIVFFRFLFIYSFFFFIFGTETNTLNAILSSCFDNTFKYFQLAQPVRDPQFKVRSPMVCLYGCNQRRTCSGLPNKRGGTWLPLCFLTSSRIIKGKSGFRLLGSIRLFNIGGWSAANRVTPHISTLLSLLANFSCFRPVFITLCPKLAIIFSTLYFVGFDPCFYSRVLAWVDLQSTPDVPNLQGKSKKVRVLGSSKQITGSKEIGKWMGRKGN